MARQYNTRTNPSLKPEAVKRLLRAVREHKVPKVTVAKRFGISAHAIDNLLAQYPEGKT
jgi:hypothetical protein